MYKNTCTDMPDHIDPPHATGAAADTVKAHSDQHPLVFYAVCSDSRIHLDEARDSGAEELTI